MQCSGDNPAPNLALPTVHLCPARPTNLLCVPPHRAENWCSSMRRTCAGTASAAATTALTALTAPFVVFAPNEIAKSGHHDEARFSTWLVRIQPRLHGLHPRQASHANVEICYLDARISFQRTRGTMFLTNTIKARTSVTTAHVTLQWRADT